jgi:hypothetical protein
MAQIIILEIGWGGVVGGGVQICLNKGPSHLEKGDNNKTAKIR